MDRKYWEKIAPDYEAEIFDVLQNDRKAIIRSEIMKHAFGSKTITDVGCAVGKWLPVLSPAFKKVIAVDISMKNLVIAQKKHGGLKNIDYLRADMSSVKTRLPRTDLAICINAILTDSMKKRDHFFKNLSRIVKKNGHLILVVPALESWMMCRIIQRKWKIENDLFNKKIPGKLAQLKYENIQDGNADIDNVPTKHYLREELDLLLDLQGFSLQRIAKIEYGWTTEFVKPPRWLKHPRPWDWMVTAKKV